jgi:hypothetical protein
MTNSKNPFATFLEGQRKMMDWWTDTSEKMMDAMSEPKKEEPTSADFMKDLFDRQQSLMEENMKMTSVAEMMEKAPEQYKKWIDLQMDFYNRWAKTYREEAQKMGFQIPDMNGFAPDRMWQKNWSNWTGQVMDNQAWLKKNILEKLPDAMQPYYLQFNDIYDDLYRRWSAFQKMIQFGIYDPKMVERYFAPQQYKDMINKLMGFQVPESAKEGLDKMNEMMDSYLKFMEQFTPSSDNWEKSWKGYMDQWNEMGHAPLLQTTMDINQRMKEGMEPFMQAFGQNKMGRYIQIMKDAQFAYTAFVLRNNELQSKMYQAGQNALPETIQSFYDEFRNSKEMPSFEIFFNRFVDHLETQLMKVLESKDYSVLQSEMSKMGGIVKAKLDEMVELSFDQTPFMMKSSGDELSKELYALRRKVRELEKKVSTEKKTTARKTTKSKASQN